MSHGFVLTVKAFDPAVGPSQQNGSPDPGSTFAAVEVSGCVPVNRPFGLSTNLFSPDAAFFRLQLDSDPSRQHLVPSQEARPNSPDIEELQERKFPEDNSFEPSPGQCNGGWVTFEVPTDSRPAFVLYQVDGSHTVDAWALT